MRGWDRGQRDEVEKVGGRKKRGVNNKKWRLLHHSRGLSFVSAGGQEIPLPLLQVGAQGPEGSARADTWSGSVHNKRTHLHGDIQTDMEGSRGQVLDLWSLTGLIHTHTHTHNLEHLLSPFPTSKTATRVRHLLAITGH